VFLSSRVEANNDQRYTVAVITRERVTAFCASALQKKTKRNGCRFSRAVEPKAWRRQKSAVRVSIFAGIRRWLTAS